MSYEDFSNGAIDDVYEQREKGHVRVHNAGAKLARDQLSFRDNNVNVRWQDSWRGHGPYAEFTRSVMLENNLTKSGAVRFNEKVFTENSQNAYAEAITRNVVPLNAQDPGIRRLQLGILLQHNPNQIEYDTEMDVDGTSRVTTVIAPHAWISHIVKHQIRIWQHDPQAYRRLSPCDVFSGWQLDGIVERDNIDLGPVRPDAVRQLTVIVRNLTAVRSYWRGAQVGSQVGIVVKKWHCTRQVVTRSSTADPDDTTLERVPLMPYTLGFYSTAYGQEPSCDIYTYTDDDGYERSDALVIQVGTVATVPTGNFPIDESVAEHCEPYSEALEQQVVDQYTPTRILVDIKVK